MVGIHKCLQESHGWENPISSPTEDWRDYSKNTIPLIKLLTLFHGMWERLQGFLCLSNWCWVVSNIWEGVERWKEMHIAKISGLVCVVGGLVITAEIHTFPSLSREMWVADTAKSQSPAKCLLSWWTLCSNFDRKWNISPIKFLLVMYLVTWTRKENHEPKSNKGISLISSKN